MAYTFTSRYYYAGGKLMRMSWGANILDFFYDESGRPYAMKYNGTVYYYITNLQGDNAHRKRQRHGCCKL